MILEAKQVTKSYGDLPILNGVNIEVKEKEIVSIVGSSSVLLFGDRKNTIDDPLSCQRNGDR